ncbi:hypothetical protein AHAS_Ahas07G0120800 [Arachis hypogaea]
MVCGHRERPILRTSTTKDNPNRRFWGCVYYEIFCWPLICEIEFLHLDFLHLMNSGWR